LYAFRQTMRVGIYDLTQKAATSLWTPQEPSVYQQGCLLGNGTALCSAALDYTFPITNEYALIRLDEEQTTVQTLSRTVQEMGRLQDGSAVFSYVDNSGTFGVRPITGNQADDVLTYTISEGSSPLRGELSVWQNQFCYACEKDFCLTMVTVEGQQERSRIRLTQQTEKLDSFCLGEESVWACLSLNEGTNQAQRIMVRWSGENRQDLLRRPATDRPLYRLSSGGRTALTVDADCRLYALYEQGDGLVAQQLVIPAQTDSRSMGALSLFGTGALPLIVYAVDKGKLYQVLLPAE